MNPEIDRVQIELNEKKLHRECLNQRLQPSKLTPQVAYTLLTDPSNNAIEYMDIIRALSVSHLTNNQQLSSEVIQKLASYNPGNMPLDLFCEALTYADRTKTSFLYASYNFIATIPDDETDSLTKIVNQIRTKLHTSYPKTEQGQRFQRIVDSIKDLLVLKHYNF